MTDSDCTVVIDRTATAVRVSIGGEFDLAAVDSVTDAIRPHLASDVVVDLAAITFMDSSGLRCLLELHAAAPGRQGRLTVSEPSPIVLRLLELSGISDQLLAVD